MPLVRRDLVDRMVLRDCKVPKVHKDSLAKRERRDQLGLLVHQVSLVQQDQPDFKD